jgi:hypothetical protein
VEYLEFALRLILEAEVPGVHPLDRYFDRPFFQKGRARGDIHSLEYLVDRYYRRGTFFDEIGKRINELSSDQARLSKDVDDGIEQIKKDSSVLAADLHHWLAIQSLGLDLSDVKISRFIPMRVYLSDVPDEGIEGVVAAIGEFVEAFGFEVADTFPEVRGSWYKKWFVKTKEVASQPEVEKRLSKIERAVELRGLGLPQAEIDERQASAVSALINAIGPIPSAAIQSGSILLLKLIVDGQATIQVRTLSQREMIVLENHQDLLDSPKDILGKLAKLCVAERDSAETINALNLGFKLHPAQEANGDHHRDSPSPSAGTDISPTNVVPRLSPPRAKGARASKRGAKKRRELIG